MRITQYLDNAPWGDITPENIYKEGMGGTETALINLGEHWAEEGHDVTQLVQISQPYTRYTKSGGSITYASNNIAVEYLTNFSQDVLVSWGNPAIFNVSGIRKNIDLGILEMQCAHMLLNEDGFDELIDGYVCLSEWAGEFLATTDARINRRKISIIPNGVDLSRYENAETRDISSGPPYKFHYSSSPDRGLHHLLKAWPDIYKAFPESELHVAYGIENFVKDEKWSHFESGQIALDVADHINQPGVVYRGKIGQAELAALQMESVAFLYPCDTMIATETGCISAVESAAAGCPMVLSDADCLAEEFGQVSLQIPLPIEDCSILNALTTLLQNESLHKELSDRGLEFAQDRSWDKISKTWLEYFHQGLN